MNILWTLLTIYHTDILLGKGENLSRNRPRKNLIHVKIQMQKDHSQDKEHYKDGISQPECKHITIYDLNELMRIKHATDNDIRYKQLSFRTVRSVCNLNWLEGKESPEKVKQRMLTRKSQNQLELYGKT